MSLINQTQIKRLSDGGSAGTTLGKSASDLVGFHGASPSDQRAVTANISTSAPISATPYGFSVTQATAIIAAINEIFALLQEKGLQASS